MTYEMTQKLQEEENEKTGRILKFTKGTPTYELNSSRIGGYYTIDDYKKDGHSLGLDFEIEETKLMKRTGLVHIHVGGGGNGIMQAIYNTVSLKDAECYKQSKRRFIIIITVAIVIIGFAIWKTKH